MKRRAARRARGFSLVEMLVAMGLAGLVIAGALQLQSNFVSNAQRQSEVNETQQSLRLTMQILERAIRASGTGMVDSKIIGGAATYYGFSFSNTNSFPQGAYDIIAGDADSDPDWFRVIAAADSVPNVATANNSGTTTVLGSLSAWNVHDLFLVVNSTSASSCLREVTSLATPTVGRATTGTNYVGMNPVLDSCMSAVTLPAPVRRFVNETDYRILLPANGSADSPRLAVRFAPIGDTTNSTWTLVSDNIEDMQIALVMSDGSICNDRDSPLLCDPSLANAVRITLVGRTAVKVPGAPGSSTGGYEDAPAAAVSDGYLRRALTSEILLRN